MHRHVTLAFAGDVMLGRNVQLEIGRRGVEYPLGNVRPALEASDGLMVNLECALTTQVRPWMDGERKRFHFRAEPEAVGTLRAAGVAFACVANNHIGDFGEKGLLDTLAVLDGAGIAHAGAGEDLARARAAARLELGGLRIAVVACTDQLEEWAATETRPGIHHVPVSPEPAVLERVRSCIAEACSGSDLVVFTIHWGPNMRTAPTATFRSFARAVIDAGADVFWGHSAHVVQGIELHRGRPILYDSGDLIDDYAVDPVLRNDLSALFLLRGGRAGIEHLEAVPVRIARGQVNLAEGEQRSTFEQRLQERSSELGTRMVSRPTGLAIEMIPEGRRT